MSNYYIWNAGWPKTFSMNRKQNFLCLPPTHFTFLTANTRRTLSAYIKPTARNFGRIFDSDLSFQPHINKPVQPCSVELRTISKIKPMLPQSHIEKIIHSIIFSILDCWDSLLSGDINNKSLPGFQLFQNAAARLQTGFKRQDHITQILASTHGSWYVFGINLRFYWSLLKPIAVWPPTVFPTCWPQTSQFTALGPWVGHFMLFWRRGAKWEVIISSPPYLLLPKEIRLADSVNCFKSILKTQLSLLTSSRVLWPVNFVNRVVKSVSVIVITRDVTAS